MTLFSPVIPKPPVKIHGIDESSGHLGDQVTVSIPEIDQLNFTCRQMENPLCFPDSGCPGKQNQQNPSLYEAVHRFVVSLVKLVAVW